MTHTRRHRALLTFLVLLCMATGAAVGGGLYEGVVLTPSWSAAPPQSFAIIQPDTGVPLQAFWMPVHALITLTVLLALGFGWRNPTLRRWLLLGLAAYIAMRAWSFAYFIPEMLSFQDVPLSQAPTLELSERVTRWTTLTWLRLPLDLLTATSFLMGLRYVGGEQA